MRSLAYAAVPLLAFAIACGGENSPASPSVPGAPTGLSALPGNQQVRLTWKACSGATAYQVMRADPGTAFTTIATSATNAYLDTKVSNGTTYRYVVCATNNVGKSGVSSEVTALPMDSLAGPTGVVATVGSGQVTLSWNACAEATGYRVKRWRYGSSFVTVASPTSNSYADAGLINGAIYRYRITALVDGVESEASEDVLGDLSAQPTMFGDSPEAAVSDDFNEGTSLDSAKWNFDLGGWDVNNELESYTDRTANVRLQDGSLVLTALKETYTGADGDTRDYTSARVNSQGKMFPKYGRIEARQPR